MPAARQHHGTRHHGEFDGKRWVLPLVSEQGDRAERAGCRSRQSLRRRFLN